MEEPLMQPTRSSKDVEVVREHIPQETCHRYGHDRRRLNALCLYISIGNVLLLLTTSVLWARSFQAPISVHEAYKASSLYSPMFEKDFSLDLGETILNSTLWGMDETTSIYIQDPSPEVDAAWDYISAEAGSIITINSEEVRRLGRDPATIVKAPEDWGFGTDAFPAQIDVFHEIHCLNMLRKEMNWDYYFRAKYGDRKDAGYLHVRHTRHCLRIVLRTLMCNSDVDIVTHNWRRGSYRPIADFDNLHKCRNFEGLLKWSLSHAVPDDMGKWRSIKRPSDAVILPRPTPNLYTAEDSPDWVNGV